MILRELRTIQDVQWVLEDVLDELKRLNNEIYDLMIELESLKNANGYKE